LRAFRLAKDIADASIEMGKLQKETLGQMCSASKSTSKGRRKKGCKSDYSIAEHLIALGENTLIRN
jgi:hypothetical protein